MSQDLTDSKKLTGSVFPEGAYDAGPGVERVEPMLTASVLKMRFLFGMPLRSPITKEVLTDEHLKDYIKRAMSQVELDAKVDLAPVVRRVRMPFDPNLYAQNIWCEIPHKPIQRVLRLAICSASYSNTSQQNDQYPSGAEIYKIPNEWIDVSYAPRGKVFVNPINPAFSAIGTSTAVAASGATILQFIGQQMWVPAYWTMEVITGYCSQNGDVPLIINELVGARAAMLVLDNLFPLFRTTSQSMGLDGMSQSTSDQFQQLLQAKRAQLEKDYAANVKKIKVNTSNQIFTSNV